MNFTAGYFKTSIGKKFVVAFTGALLLGFVIAHMAGNLQIFAGAEKINTYAKFLKDLGPLLWIARIGLLVAIFFHIYFTVQLNLANYAARPVKYAMMKTKQATSASLYMAISGMTIFAFIVYHLLHFTLGVTNPEFLNLEYSLNGEKVHDVYAMIVMGFQVPIVSAAYIIAMGLLCWHLSHGVSSIFQTLGIDSPKMNPRLKILAYSVAAIIFVGNVSIPLTILLGLVK
jgi:succinate dehydrogenase / fumarate reductase cytochrome b subunit